MRHILSIFAVQVIDTNRFVCRSDSVAAFADDELALSRPSVYPYQSTLASIHRSWKDGRLDWSHGPGCTQ